MLEGGIWNLLRICQALFHQENFDLVAIACWTRTAFETSGGGGGL